MNQLEGKVRNEHWNDISIKEKTYSIQNAFLQKQKKNAIISKYFNNFSLENFEFSRVLIIRGLIPFSN